MIRKYPLTMFFIFFCFIVFFFLWGRARVNRYFFPPGSEQARFLQRLGRGRPTVTFLNRLQVVLPSVLACLLLGLWYLKRQARIAEDVLTRLHRGELGARLPEGKLASYGGLVETFNRMAGDVESLVTKLRRGEEVRSETLKELAHDVRTPLSSLQLLLEELTSKHRGERALATARAEVSYVQQIVESFLVLAQLEEPDFKKAPSPVPLYDAIMQEALPFQDLPEKIHLRWTVKSALPAEQTIAVDSFLFSRALRNVFSNAVRFARTRVEVLVERNATGALALTITDDGPGFSAEALARFGERRKIRLVDPAVPGNASIGLGAVILTKIVANLGGTVVARNGAAPDGAQVVLTLPAELLGAPAKAPSTAA